MISVNKKTIKRDIYLGFQLKMFDVLLVDYYFEIKSYLILLIFILPTYSLHLYIYTLCKHISNICYLMCV